MIAVKRLNAIFAVLATLCLANQHAIAEAVFVASFGTLGQGDGEFDRPYDLALDSSGNVWVADDSNNRIQKFDRNGTYLSQFGTAGRGDGQFKFSVSVAVDSSGNLLVCDYGNNRIQKFDSSGTYLSQFGRYGFFGGEFLSPTDVNVDSSGYIWVCDNNNNRIQKFDSTGKYLSQFGTEGSANGQLQWPGSMTVSLTGNVWVADTFNNRFQEFDSSGRFVRRCGAFGTGNGQFDKPTGIAVDAAENVWVADCQNNRIQVFNSNGAYITQFGTFGTENGQFRSPSGLAIDALGNVWVADYSNYRIQEFSVAVLNTIPAGGSVLNFGRIRQGTTGARTVTAANVGSAGSTLSAAFSTPTGDFGTDASASLGPLGRGDQVGRDYTYTPTNRGADTQSITISSDGGNSTVTLMGIGVGPRYHSDLTSDSILDYGDVALTDRKPLFLNLSNTSADSNGGDSNLTDLTILDAMISGQDSSLFSIVSFTRGTILHKGDTINVEVDYVGDGTFGLKSATLTIRTDEDAAFGVIGNTYAYQINANVVPEPSTFVMLGVSATLLLTARFGQRCQSRFHKSLNRSPARIRQSSLWPPEARG